MASRNIPSPKGHPAGGLTVTEMQRLKELEKENAWLKRLLAARELDVDVMQALLPKK